MPEYLRCRLCAEFKVTSSLINIGNEAAQALNLKNKVKDCFNLDFEEVTPVPLLPKHVCLPCCEKVNLFFEFKEQVRKAQEIFRSSVVDTILPVKTETEETSDSYNEPNESFENCENLLNNDENKVKDELQEGSCENEVDENRKSNSLDDLDIPNISLFIGSEKEESTVPDPGEEKPIRWRTPKISELNPESAIDSAERSEAIIRRKEAWKSYKWRCCLCKKVLPSVEKLQTHFLKIHKKDPQYSCWECSKVFAVYARFRHHHRKKHRFDHNYRCPTCSKSFYLKKHYEAHLEKHDPKNQKRYNCSLCDKTYSNSESLRVHKKIIHELKREQKCETCGKLFVTKSDLANHQKIHTKESRIMYTCEKCGKSFVTPGSLKYHNETAHSDDKPFCCPHCEKRFKAASLLKTHLETHNTEYKYTCETCGKAFRTRRAMRTHSIIHTDKFPYECEYCQKGFRKSCQLNVHKRQHTGERPYYCEECNVSFVDSSNCLKHMRRKHNVNSVKKYADVLKERARIS